MEIGSAELLEDEDDSRVYPDAARPWLVDQEALTPVMREYDRLLKEKDAAIGQCKVSTCFCFELIP